MKLKQAANDYEFDEFYELGPIIGKGKFSNVHVCQHRLTKELLAVKIIEKKSLNLVEKNFLKDEIMTVKTVHHKNIIKFKDIYENDQNVYVV